MTIMTNLENIIGSAKTKISNAVQKIKDEYQIFKFYNDNGYFGSNAGSNVAKAGMLGLTTGATDADLEKQSNTNFGQKTEMISNYKPETKLPQDTVIGVVCKDPEFLFPGKYVAQDIDQVCIGDNIGNPESYFTEKGMPKNLSKNMYFLPAENVEKQSDGTYKVVDLPVTFFEELFYNNMVNKNGKKPMTGSETVRFIQDPDCIGGYDGNKGDGNNGNNSNNGQPRDVTIVTEISADFTGLSDGINRIADASEQQAAAAEKSAAADSTQAAIAARKLQRKEDFFKGIKYEIGLQGNSNMGYGPNAVIGVPLFNSVFTPFVGAGAYLNETGKTVTQEKDYNGFGESTIVNSNFDHKQNFVYGVLGLDLSFPLGDNVRLGTNAYWGKGKIAGTTSSFTDEPVAPTGWEDLPSPTTPDAVNTKYSTKTPVVGANVNLTLWDRLKLAVGYSSRTNELFNQYNIDSKNIVSDKNMNNTWNVKLNYTMGAKK